MEFVKYKTVSLWITQQSRVSERRAMVRRRGFRREMVRV
jgi:hypothetical protein